MIMKFARMLQRKGKDEKGFTLIELMVVVMIIGILAALAIPSFVNATTKSKQGKAKADLRTYGTALELYYTDNDTYPETGSLANLKPTYMKTIPDDPWGHDYVFVKNGTGASATYDLYSQGSDTGSSTDDIKIPE